MHHRSTHAAPGTWSASKERRALADAWRVYDRLHLAIFEGLLATARRHPELRPLVGGRPELAAARDAWHARVRRAVAGDWGTFDADLRRLAAGVGTRGVSVAGWYVVAQDLVRRLEPALVEAYRDPPERLAAALAAMHQFLDRALLVLAGTGVAANDAASGVVTLAGQLEAAREEERARIARDLHDEIGQHLAGLHLDLAWLARRIARPGQSAEVAECLEAMARHIDAGVESVRHLTASLRPDVLDLGLAAALGWQAREVATRSGLAIGVEIDPAAPEVRGHQATAMFRIFQALLTNVVRHAGATQVRARLDLHAGAIRLVVQDDGGGIAAAALASPASMGLRGMRERAAAFGGTVELHGSPGAGTTATVVMPLPPPAGTGS